MLRIDVDKKKEISVVEAQGPLPEIINDLLLAIGAIGKSLNDKSHMLGRLYEMTLKAALDDGMAISSRPQEDGELSIVGSGSGIDEAFKNALEQLKKGR